MAPRLLCPGRLSSLQILESLAFLQQEQAALHFPQNVLLAVGSLLVALDQPSFLQKLPSERPKREVIAAEANEKLIG
jgi:hypothetical protein